MGHLHKDRVFEQVTDIIGGNVTKDAGDKTITVLEGDAPIHIPQDITATVGGSGNIVADGSRPISVSAVGTGEVTKHDTNNTIVCPRGVWQLTCDITSTSVTNGDRTAPQLGATGTNVSIMDQSNPYLRESRATVTVKRHTMIFVQDNNTEVTLHIENPEIIDGTQAFGTISASGLAVANIRIMRL